ncbi:hypothetical protein VNI00_010841 [Paramarasmius palmivorus]|uniref:F-box domain-containing protein n=1 Tax=Paramarasmius palmivorus TaxID=297713 RepID=A0AAW0CEX1_9AGAR
MTPAHTQSHIQSLPPEILSTIFILTNVKPYKTNVEEWIRSTLKPYGDSLKLNGSLGSSILILISHKMHLQRSESHPLSISLKFHWDFDFDSCREFLKSSQVDAHVAFHFLKTIIDHAGRIQRLLGLKDLRIHTADKKFDWDAYKGMVTALWEGQEPLRPQSVYLSTYCVVPPDDVAIWMRDMQSHGRAIRINVDRYGEPEVFDYRDGPSGMPDKFHRDRAEVWDEDGDWHPSLMLR